MIIECTQCRSSCLIYSIKIYFRLKKIGYKPRFVYCDHHFLVELWLNNKVFQFEFLGHDCNSWFQMFFHILPFSKGLIYITSEDLLNG